MKKRLLPLVTALLALLLLLVPMGKLELHCAVDPTVAAQFPASISMGQVFLQGTSALPIQAVPELACLELGQGLLGAGLALLLISSLLALWKKRGMLLVSLTGTVVAAALLGTFALQISNVGSSLLFTLLLNVQAWVFLPLVCALVQRFCC